MKKSLVIVESPAKCKTLSKFLGEGFEVVPSMGHLIDLPSSTMGVDVENNFVPKYVVIPSRKKILKQLKDKAMGVSVIYLATDPDREGEAISWHLYRELADNKKSLRVEFHEITKTAIDEAFKTPRDIDMNKVNAQQARRILDRIVGYNLSPLLWEKVGKGLSAGRVQSVALRLIVEREKAILAFKPQEYWDIEAELSKQKDPLKFIAKLIKLKGKKPHIKNQASADNLVALLQEKDFAVIGIKEQKRVKVPPPAYTTSKMQQEAFNKLRFSASRTMRLAQQLYEGLEVGGEDAVGLITYMRTDSVRVSVEAERQVRDYIAKNFGKEYIPKHPHKTKSKQKTQDAHEAIRPTSVHRVPQEIKKYLSPDQFKLYELIWRRFVQSQMSSAIIKGKSVDISARDSGQTEDIYIFRTTGSEILFEGFLRLAPEKDRSKDPIMPALDKGELLRLLRIIPSQHFTKPPARFSDATLVKELEENGIGRPSTYAPTISTIAARHYVDRKAGYFYPTEVGIVVTDLLVKHFPDILNVSFTAEMEEELDKVEEANMEWVAVLNNFYAPFKKDLAQAHVNMEDIKKRKVRTDYKCELCGRVMLFRWSRRGTFLGCSGFPRCKNTKPARKTEEGKIELVEVETTDQVCEKCQKPMIVKQSRRGRFLSCSGYPQCKNTKPFPTGVKCPQEGCGGELVEKYSRRGPFYGCSNYPECKYTTRKLDTGSDKK